MWKWIKGKAMLWVARRIAAALGKTLVKELNAMAKRSEMTPGAGDDAGVKLLQGIVDPAYRSRQTNLDLRALGQQLEDRAKSREGYLDDAGVIILRGALNC